MLISVESTYQQPIDQPHSVIPAQQYTEQYLAACRVDPMPETPNGASATSCLASSYAWLREMGETCGKRPMARLMRHDGLHLHTGYHHHPMTDGSIGLLMLAQFDNPCWRWSSMAWGQEESPSKPSGPSLRYRVSHLSVARIVTRQRDPPLQHAGPVQGRARQEAVDQGRLSGHFYGGSLAHLRRLVWLAPPIPLECPE